MALQNKGTKGNRTANGSLLGVGIALCMIVVLTGFGFFHISALMGSAIEFRNAVDAGTLSATRQSMSLPAVGLNRISQEMQVQIKPLCENDKVGLRTINRLAAAELLVEMNEYAMQAEGTSTGSSGSTGHARQFDSTIALLCEDLSAKFEKKQAELLAFTELANLNKNNLMADANPTVPATAEWGSAYMNAGTASNIYFDPEQIPAGYEADLPYSSITLSGTTRHYVAGYMPLPEASTDVVRPSNKSYFVPLRPGLKPHLVASEEFSAQSSKPTSVNPTYCLPNSISIPAKTVSNAGQQLNYRAYALAEAADVGFAAQLPAGYIRIENTAKSIRKVNFFDYINDPAGDDLRKRLRQRILQIDPSFEPNIFNSSMQFELEPGKAVVIQLTGSPRPEGARTSKPDGNRNLSPYVFSDGAKIQWIPSTGHNGLLAVVEIEA